MAQEPSVRWKPPLCVVWVQERGDSLPSCVIKQNTDDRAASVGRRAVAGRSGRWCNQLLGGAKKIEGSFFCGVLVVCRARCQYGPPSRAAVSNHRLKRTWIMHARTHECVARHIHPLRIDHIPMNIPRNCTRSPTYLLGGGRTGLGVVVHSTVHIYASMEYSVVWSK